MQCVSNSVIASSSRGRGRGRNSRNRDRSSRVRGNQKPSKTVDDYQWGTIYNSANTNVTAHPYFETSGPAHLINENLQPLEFFYKTFLRKIIQQIAAETNRYYAQSQQNIKNKYTKWVDVTETELIYISVKIALKNFIHVVKHANICLLLKKNNEKKWICWKVWPRCSQSWVLL